MKCSALLIPHTVLLSQHILISSFHAQTVENIRSWLCRRLACWATFEVAARAKYLGYFMGTKVADVQWAQQTAKWKARAKMVALLGASAQTTFTLYHRFALPVVGYVAQLVPMPKANLTAERHLMSSLMHVPANSFNIKSPFSLHALGGPNIRSVAVFSYSVVEGCP